MTIALAFLASSLTGATAQRVAAAENAEAVRKQVAKLTEEIRLDVESHRNASCRSQVDIVKLLVDLPGTPTSHEIQDCSHLPGEEETEYELYIEKKE